jgi:glycolate oxidase iron-sulfur subunit
MVARGKLSLIEAHEKKELLHSRKFQELIEACLLCGGCANQCANGVRADDLIQWHRSRLRQEGRTSWTARLLTHILEAAGQWSRLLGPATTLAQALLCKKIPADSGLQLRFSALAMSQRSYVPKLSGSPFLTKVGGQRLGSGIRVGLFVGCVGNYIAPQISEAIVELLLRTGFQVIIPADQRCCGMAAWASGDTEAAAALAEHNVRAFVDSGCQWVVSGCGTCSTHLRLRLPGLLGEHAQDAGRFFSQNAMDLLAFIPRELQPERIRRGLKSPGHLKLSYHDPCHLRYHQAVFEQPRQLLSLLPEVELAELAGVHQCCGHGGLFNVSNYRLSTQVGDRKMAQVGKASPDVLATSCMGCLLQLQEGNWRLGLGLDVRHLVEVLMGKVTG